MEGHIDSPAAATDIHRLPVNEIFAFFADAGFRPLEVQMDAFSVAYATRTSFAMRAD